MTGGGHGTSEQDRGRAAEEGKRAVSHFLGGATVVDGKRMHCGLLEEADMDSTGQTSSLFFVFFLICWLCGETELHELLPACGIFLNFSKVILNGLVCGVV